jgi:hypothetical protein
MFLQQLMTSVGVEHARIVGVGNEAFKRRLNSLPMGVCLLRLVGEGQSE